MIIQAVTPPETFWTLLQDAAHWEFEIFLMIVFDGIIGYLGFRLFWPYLKKHWQHHIDRDNREILEKQNALIPARSILGPYGIKEEDVISWTLTDSTLTVILRNQNEKSNV